MKGYRKGLLISLLLISLVISSLIFFYYKTNEAPNTLISHLNTMLFILTMNLAFFGLMFLVDFSIYKIVLKFTIILGLYFWAFSYMLQFFEGQVSPLRSEFWHILDFLAYSSYSMLASGLVLYIIHYIRISTEKYEQNEYFGYHFHESFFGIILIGFSAILLMLRSFLIQFDIFLKELNVIYVITSFILYLFLYIGGFFIFRDYLDFIKFKFLEKKTNDQKKYKTNSGFQISEEDVEFFTLSRIKLYPIGILLTFFSISALVFGRGFLIPEIFALSSEYIELIGFILSFLAGAMIGKDWFRIYAHIYPELYQEIQEIIESLKER